MEYGELTRPIIGAAMEVHGLLGPGFLEAIYHRALSKELRLRGLTVETERRVEILYKGDIVGKHRMDFVVSGAVVVELKSVSAIVQVHVAQVLSYLTASRLPVGLILNFGEASLTWKRIVKSAKSAKSAAQ